jgi:microcystin degradation protein MlrC
MGSDGRVVLVGGFLHELHSFVPGISTLDVLLQGGATADGPAIFGPELGIGLELDAVADVARETGLELIPTTYLWGGVGPIVADEVYETVREKIVAGARENAGRIDGVMLVLHGAMATVSIDDTEADIIAAVRDVVGPEIPIVATFDMHGHGTAAMAANADALLGYRTCPHTDYYGTAERAMRLLVRAMDGEVDPVVSTRKIRMTASAEHHDTTNGPMVEVQARARELERRPGVLDVTVLATQPWMDLPDIGWTVYATTDDDAALGQEVADELGRFIWERREAFRVPKTPIPDAIAQALAVEGRPVVLADSADTTSGGGNGDGNILLASLLRSPVDEPVILTVTDAPAVAACFEAGIGADVTVQVGGTQTPDFFSPVPLSGRVVTLADGRYLSELPIKPRDVGRIAVVEHRSLSVVLTEVKASQLDPSIYHRAGLWPQHAKIVQVKSAGGFRAGFDPISAATIYIDTLGPADSDLTRLPFRRITRPLWPFDPDLAEPWEGAGG